jgi:hypothetical protein
MTAMKAQHFPIDLQIDALRREIRRRKDESQARHEIEVMEDALYTLEEVQEERRPAGSCGCTRGCA